MYIYWQQDKSVKYYMLYNYIVLYIDQVATQWRGLGWWFGRHDDWGSAIKSIRCHCRYWRWRCLVPWCYYCCFCCCWLSFYIYRTIKNVCYFWWQNKELYAPTRVGWGVPRYSKKIYYNKDVFLFSLISKKSIFLNILFLYCK